MPYKHVTEAEYAERVAGALGRLQGAAMHFYSVVSAASKAVENDPPRSVFRPSYTDTLPGATTALAKAAFDYVREVRRPRKS